MLTTLGQLGALFTAPALAAAGAAAVSIPIAIHLLSRLRRAKVVWAAMRFLEEAWKRQRRRMQLEQLLLLLVRCLLLAVLGLALAGPQSALLGALGLSQSSRLVCVVLDDSITTRADDVVVGGFLTPSRFEALKATAISIIDATANGDRVALWTTSSPVTQRMSPGPVDRDAARKLIEALKPTYAKADMPGVMMEVQKVVSDADLPRDRVVVTVVSDFALGSLNPAEPAPGVMSQLAERAMVWLRRPNLAMVNVQVTSLTSTRGMLLASSLSPLSVPLTVGLSRFGSDAADELCLVHVELVSADGRQSRKLDRELRWSAGQSEAVLNIDAPAAEMLPGGGVMIIKARVESITPRDVLAADDERWTTLEVKQQLRVGLIDERAAVTNNHQALTQGKWLELALAPAAGRSMELAALDVQKLNEAMVKDQDALLLFRPDLVSEAGWKMLAAAAKNGKLVWVFTPAGQEAAGEDGVRSAVTGGLSNWPDAMRSAFDLPWSIGMEATTFDEPVSLASDVRVPEALAMLGPDWADMVRPVRLFKALNLNLQGAPAREAWLRSVDGRAVMASRAIERGQLLFMAVSIDPSWTDLMVKPLFVPLVHETLRGVLGQMARRQEGRLAAVGQNLVLPASWEKVDRVKLHAGHENVLGEDAGVQGEVKVVTQRATIGDEATGKDAAVDLSGPVIGTVDVAGGVNAGEMMVRVTDGPLLLPGVYRGVTGSGTSAVTADEKMVALNVDAAGGDTRAGAPASLVAWFGLDELEPWLDAGAPGGMLKETVRQADLGLPLLWTVLALLLLETMLARRFSHGQATDVGPSWLGRWWQRMVS